MVTVWKYEIPEKDEFELEIPKGAVILTVQVQYDKPNIWCLVDPQATKEKRTFRLAGTGHSIDDFKNMKYIGTFQLFDGKFIGHLFEIKEMR